MNGTMKAGEAMRTASHPVFHMSAFASAAAANTARATGA
jgi:hypothetical protein